MRGVFLDLDTVVRAGDVDLSALRRALGELRTFGATPAEEVVPRVGDLDVVLINKVKLGAAVLGRFPRVRLVCLAATGFNNVDIDTARARGIAVCNVPAYATPSLAQQVFALLLALNQHLKEYEALLQSGVWRRAPQFTLLEYPIRELAGKTFGIVGYGDTGRAVARIAQSFGMRVAIAARNGADQRPGRLPLAELLAQVDVLSLHVPLLPETRGLIGPAQLALMKPSAILINCARGGLVDEPALADALKGGRLAGAGVDVLSEEPPVHGNALLVPGIPNLIVTPHIAWAAREARQRVIDEMALNVRAFGHGEARNRVA
ncbi:MAG: D-2-hydroxyacid dehydrogenase [Gammaproteobacteria bacterium]